MKEEEVNTVTLYITGLSKEDYDSCTITPLSEFVQSYQLISKPLATGWIKMTPQLLLTHKSYGGS